MKLFTTLFLSLIIAALICLFMIDRGILKPAAGVELNAAVPKAQRILTRLVEALPETSQGKVVLPQPQSRPITQNDSVAASGQPGDETYPKILAYLKVNAGQPEFETNLINYLEQECRLDPLKKEEYLRMILWKNFVTLQRAWQPGEEKNMWAAFSREKALKQAGFVGRGLELMTNELNLAETRLQEMFSSLALAHRQGDGA